jgi:hypothetical protein
MHRCNQPTAACEHPLLLCRAGLAFDTGPRHVLSCTIVAEFTLCSLAVAAGPA